MSGRNYNTALCVYVTVLEGLGRLLLTKFEHSTDNNKVSKDLLAGVKGLKKKKSLKAAKQ